MCIKIVLITLLAALCQLAIPQCERYNDSVAEHLPER